MIAWEERRAPSSVAKDDGYPQVKALGHQHLVIHHPSYTRLQGRRLTTNPRPKVTRKERPVSSQRTSTSDDRHECAMEAHSQVCRGSLDYLSYCSSQSWSHNRSAVAPCQTLHSIALSPSGAANLTDTRYHFTPPSSWTTPAESG